MKRLSKKQKWWQLRLIRKIKRKLSLRANKTYYSAREYSNEIFLNNYPNKIYRPDKRILKNTVKSISAPKIFNIQDDKYRPIVTRFLSSLRDAFSDTNIDKIVLDFTHTEQFVADATLLFFSEVLYLKEKPGVTAILRYKPPINERASDVLHQIGFHVLCGGNATSGLTTNDEDVVHWRFAQGSIVDNSLCAPAIEQYEGQLAAPLMEGLFRGLGEAMTNTSHHAYLETRKDNLNYKPPTKNWWMFSQSKDEYLSVVFCDLGIGIPRTLPLTMPEILKRLVRLKKPIKDSECIKKAVQHGLSRTKQPERGKGLGDIVEVVTKKKTGQFSYTAIKECIIKMKLAS